MTAVVYYFTRILQGVCLIDIDRVKATEQEILAVRLLKGTIMRHPIAHIDTPNPREIRHKLGLNQHQFWSAVGVTQSGGSRYETGRSMPRSVQLLLRIVHVEQIDIKQVKGEDLAAIAFLRENDPHSFKAIKAAARLKRKKG